MTQDRFLDGKILKLVGRGQTENQEDMIRMLEAALEEVKSGDVAGFYMVIDRGEDGWSERVSNIDGLRMLGILTAIREQTIRSVLED